MESNGIACIHTQRAYCYINEHQKKLFRAGINKSPQALCYSCTFQKCSMISKNDKTFFLYRGALSKKSLMKTCGMAAAQEAEVRQLSFSQQLKETDAN